MIEQNHRSPRSFNGMTAPPIAAALKSATPALLFGLRLWVSVCLALYIAFWLQLDNAYWAGTSAAIVCQPRLGASLRKGWFRMIGTVAGAVFIVILTAFLPQQRMGFLLILALWVGVCALIATLLRNFASYAAALAGVTAVIIAGDQLGAVGGVDGQVFFYAYTRTSEICIGIVCAGVVLAATDMGSAQRRLAALFAGITDEIMCQFALTLSRAGPRAPDSRPIRRELIRRVVALQPVIDEAIGEASQLRAHSPMLYAAVERMFDTLASWRTVAAHLSETRPELARAQAEIILQRMPPNLQAAALQHASMDTAEIVLVRERYSALARTLIAMPAETPSLRLLADHTARVLAGIAGSINGLVLLVDGPVLHTPRSAEIRPRVADWLPAFINAMRASVTICVVELLWIVTAWPNGAGAITFATIGVTVFSPKDDQAYASTIRYMVGVLLTVACAAIEKFVLLPGLSTFTAFSLALGVFLVPLGAMTAQSWQAATFTAAAAIFTPLLTPENQMGFDTQQFYNSALATLIGIGAAAFSFRLLTPLTPAMRSRRLLALTLQDLRRLATDPDPRTAADWKGVAASRLSVLPDAAEPLQRAQLITALSMGAEIVRLRRIARRLGLTSLVVDALQAFAQARSGSATKYLAALDNALASRLGDAPGASGAMRARGSILVVSEGLAQHAEYFDAVG
jgi:uncharacterized membrane protein YccC